MDEPVWTEIRFGELEINLREDWFEKGATINIGANTKITLDKMYGPLAAGDVRIFLDYTSEHSDWVLEYRNPGTDEWIEKIRFDCQENWPEEDLSTS
jgi:hypothetical protein